jgi:carboxyl-terminal processing protease
MRDCSIRPSRVATAARAIRNTCAVVLLGTLALAACGDDESTQDQVSQYYARCAMPRTGIDPSTNMAYDDRRGSVDDEKRFLRAWIDDLYLWYREVPPVKPEDFATALDYFDELRTRATTASGKPKDQFHFTYPTEEWNALSRSGVEGGYGVQWTLLSSRPPRQAVAAYVEPGSPAARANIARGASVLTVDGVDLVNGADTDTLNAGLFPSELGIPHTFEIRDQGSAVTRTVTMTSASITSTPVQNIKTLQTATGPVGYLTFNDHIATAEAGLSAAISALKSAQITDLVLDIRYNGGGFLAIAAQLSYMIAGPAATTGKAFETLTYNDKYRTTDPFSGRALAPRPFLSQAIGFSLPNGQELPSLGLRRVFVLTGPGTCSASESVINGLRGIDVEVIQIGATTCGKPYGFVPQDNCGTTYFAIQFQGINQKGYGDYADGFSPAGVGDSGVPGCVVADDFTHNLGDPSEARLAAALTYRATGRCPALALTRRDGVFDLSASDGVTVKSAWRSNRIVSAPSPTF